MNLLPKASGTRPRVACEISPQGVVAAGSAAGGGPITGVALVELAEGAVSPGLKPGNVVDRVAVTAALRRALEEIGLKTHARGADIGLVLPDGAVRVLLLDFDALPNKLTEALPIVRFRLKKMLPFDADDAMISFQVMSSGKAGVRVLAVAIPRDVLSEYETVAREAGFEPGAVLPSTLAVLAGVDGEAPVLLVNANRLGVTTAIVRAGIVLLHLSVDLQQSAAPEVQGRALPLVSREDSVGEWAAQQAMPEHGRNPYAELPPVLPPLAAKPQTAPLAEEIAQAVSKGAAYFEDTLAIAPTVILSAGPVGAEALRRTLGDFGLTEEDGLKVREVVESAGLMAEAASARVPRGWMAGVAGALRD